MMACGELVVLTAKCLLNGDCRRFVETRLPELRMLNQNTFFEISEMPENIKVESAVHVIYGDST